jgi:lipopolysaccharide/colanic/teichoic acid biosynthesis glycosyltransferase
MDNQNLLLRGSRGYAVRRVLAHPLSQLVVQLLAALLPAAFLWLVVSQGSAQSQNFQNTLSALFMGAGMAWFAMGRLRTYAKARLLSYVFPVNFIAYAGVLGLIAVFRLDYSVFQFVYGAAGGVFASFVLTIAVRRVTRLQYVVGGGRTNEIAMAGQYVPAPSPAEVQSLIEAKQLDGSIVADLHHDHSPEWERLFAKASLAGMPVYHYRQVAEAQSGQVKINHLSENDLGSLIPNAPYMTTKRLLDILISLALLPFCAIGFVIVGILIKLDSPGSAFFVQERIGFRGKSFRMVKFRTMRERAVADDEAAKRQDAMTKSDDDRITRLGRFLRKTRIDELPQILNVLRGEMSWIGPRPEAKSLSDWYERELPFYSYRHIVRPGITGWAQVNQGHVTDVTDVNAKLRFDFYYVKNISMWLDFLIVLKTFRVIFTGIGAK